MLLIFGLAGYRKTLGVLPALCGRCHNHCPHHVLREGNRFSLFFIPLFPVSSRYAFTCSICGQQRPLSKDEAMSLASGGGAGAGYPEASHYPPPEPGTGGGFPRYPQG